MRRQGSEIAVRGPERDRNIVRRNGLSRKFAMALQKRRDLVFAFFRLQRAGAIDEHPARLHEARRVRQKLRLQARQCLNVVVTFQKRISGWRRIVPVAVHGVSRSTASNVLSDANVSASAVAVSAVSPSRSKLPFNRCKPPGRFVDSRDVGASGRELRRFPTRSGTKIERVKTRNVAKQLHGQRRRCVLNPPGAFGVALELFDAAGAGASHRPIRQHDTAETLGPVLGIGLDGQIERRLRQRCPRDLSSLRRSVDAGPSRQQPIGNSQSDIVERGKASAAALTRSAAARR